MQSYNYDKRHDLSGKVCTHEHCVCCISVSAPRLETSVMNHDCRSNAALAAAAAADTGHHI